MKIYEVTLKSEIKILLAEKKLLKVSFLLINLNPEIFTKQCELHIAKMLTLN